MTEQVSTTTFFLLRGLAREIRHWGDFPEVLKNSGEGIRVEPLEIPGAGKLRNTRAPMATRDYVENIREQYLQRVSFQDTNILFGLSFGGMIAASWLDAYPDDFQAAVLANTSSRNCPFYNRLSPEAMRVFLAAMLSGDIGKQETRLANLICNTADAEEIARQWCGIARSAPMSSLNKLRQLYTAAVFSLPPAPSVPTLLLCSIRDRLCAPLCSEKIRAAWACRLIYHAEAGHDLTTDDPRWCSSTLLSWRASLDISAG